MFARQLLHQLNDEMGPADDWAEARCLDDANGSTALFFSDQIADIARAKSICNDCPLIAPCLEGASARREPWGVWGGQLFFNGRILAQKRKRGRPPKNRPVDIQLTA